MKSTKIICLSTLVTILLLSQIFSSFAVRTANLKNDDLAIQKHSQVRISFSSMLKYLMELTLAIV